MSIKKRVIRVLVSGFSGRMGGAVCDAVCSNRNFELVAGVSYRCAKREVSDSFDIYSSFKDIVNVPADVVIDFSHSDVTEELLDFSLRGRIPVVIGTTGHNREQLAKIREAARCIPVFYSRNMSVGASILLSLCRKVSKILKGSCDVEIVEKHHRYKKDAPSGTALMIAGAVSKSWGGRDVNLVFDRSGAKGVRKLGEIGISSVRAGTIAGEHDVIFGLDDETITLSHTAQSRRVFAKGALLAAEFVLNKPAKLYTMEDFCADKGFC